MDIPVTYDDLKIAYTEMAAAIRHAFDTQVDLNRLEGEKADAWARMLERPDFKPGRSNMEQAAKLRAEYPEFMVVYEHAFADAEHAKLDVDLVRTKVSMYQSLLSLGKILVALKEEAA